MIMAEAERLSRKQPLISGAPLTVRDLRGIVPALPGRITSDFEDLIEEAMEKEADRIVRDMEGHSPIQPC